MDAGQVVRFWSFVKNSMDQIKQIRSFRDLIVYQSLYKACLQVMREILPHLLAQERFDLRDQLSRSSKAAPRLVAEGYAKRHQRRGFQKYLDDALAESNECIVSLEQVKDIYAVKNELCTELIHVYDICSRQLYKLSTVWNKFDHSAPPSKSTN